jgi:hypothetical protein
MRHRHIWRDRNKEKNMNKFFEKLPFKKLAEKIPAGTRAKVPLLDKAIPFANQIVCGLAVVLLVTVIACSGKGGNSGGSSGGGNSSSGKVKFTMASESDFEVTIAPDGTAIITKYKGKGGNIAVPATIQGVQVTQIGIGAFSSDRIIDNSGLTGIQLPEGIKKIGDAAFAYLDISTIIIPDSVTVFEYSILSNTKSLKSFTFPAGLIASKKIPTGMFGSTGLSGSLVIPEGIETIEDGAFGGCWSLTSVTLPSTIKRIEHHAFYSCSELMEVIIPESVTSLRWGDSTFNDSFNYCSKLNLASQARLRALGYKWDF